MINYFQYLYYFHTSGGAAATRLSSAPSDLRHDDEGGKRRGRGTRARTLAARAQKQLVANCVLFPLAPPPHPGCVAIMPVNWS